MEPEPPTYKVWCYILNEDVDRTLCEESCADPDMLPYCLDVVWNEPIDLTPNPGSDTIEP